MLKQRDESWQRTFDEMKKHYNELLQAAKEAEKLAAEKVTKLSAEQEKALLTHKYELLQEVQVELQKKSTQIEILTENIQFLSRQLYGNSDYSLNSSGKQEASPRISKLLGDSMSRNLTQSPKSSLRKLDFEGRTKMEETSKHSSLPDFDELTQRFEKHKI